MSDHFISPPMSSKSNCVEIELVHTEIEIAHEVASYKIKNDFFRLHKIDSLDIDVLVNNTTLGEMMKSKGLHKLNALMYLDELLLKAIFDMEETIKPREVTHISRVFYISTDVKFKTKDEDWKFIGLIKQKKYQGQYFHLYYATLKRKEVKD